MSTPTIRRISSYGHVEIEWPGQRPASVMVASEILDGWADTMNEIAEIRRTGNSRTPAYIEARLPRTEAGIGGHLDLTDDDDRREMAHLLHRMLFAESNKLPTVPGKLEQPNE